MQYLLMLYADESGWNKMSKAEQQQGYAAYMAYTEALKKAGAWVGSNRLQPVATATTVRNGSNGKAQVQDGPNDEGQMFQRPGRPSDPMPKPFPNDQAARAANNGALPPDLSLIVKAREGGADYVYAILTGFKDPPKDFKMTEGTYYNEYFAGHQIKMPPPLTDGQVKFADGAPDKVADEARDVVSFLTWAAEPNLDQRHRMGFKVMLFLIIATGVFYAAKRKIWSRIEH